MLVGLVKLLAGRLTSNKFIAIHIELLLHSTQKRIVDVCLINVLEEVPNGSKRQDKSVNLEKKPSLLLGQLPCIPDVALPGLAALFALFVVSR